MLVTSATPLRTRSRCAGGAPRGAMTSTFTRPWVASSTCFAQTLVTPSVTGCVGGSQFEYFHTTWAWAGAASATAATATAASVLIDPPGSLHERRQHQRDPRHQHEDRDPDHV